MTPSPPSSSSRTSGLTLVEVLLALFLFGLAFTVLTQVFVNTLLAMDTAGERADRKEQFRFIRSVVLEMPDRDEVEDGGTIETLDLGPATWEAEVEETTVADLFRVQLTITLDGPLGDNETRTDTLYVVRPTWSEPIERSKLIADAQERWLDLRETTAWR